MESAVPIAVDPFSVNIDKGHCDLNICYVLNGLFNVDSGNTRVAGNIEVSIVRQCIVGIAGHDAGESVCQAVMHRI